VGADQERLAFHDKTMETLETRFSSSKRLVLLALLASSAFMLSLISWTLSSPLGSSPDETFHIGSIWCAQGEKEGRCEYVDDSIESHSTAVIVPHVMDVCFIFYSEQSGDCSRDPRSDQPELVSNTGLYPTLFYSTHNLLVSDKTQVSGLSMRLLNSLIACFVLFMAIVLSPLKMRASGLIPFAVTLIPLAMFLIPSLNPSSWAYVGVGFAWIFHLNAISITDFSVTKAKRFRLANWIMFVFCSALAMGSRWDSMFFACLSIICVFLIARSERIKLDRISIIVPTLVLTLGISLLLNHYWLTALSGGSVFGNPDSISSGWTVGYRNLHNIVNLIGLPAGIFGLGWGIGWLDTPLPTIVGLIGISSYGFFLLESIPYRLKSHYFLMLFLWITSAGILMYYLWGSSIVVGEVVQPRYILPMLPLILGIGLFSSKFDSFLEAKMWARFVVIGALITISHSVGLWTNIRRYTLGLETNQGYNLSSPTTPIEWWWRWAPSPNIVFLVGAISFLIFIFTLLKIIVIPDKVDVALDEESRIKPKI
jgi:hypothetical protein